MSTRNRKRKPSYVYATVSIALVLFPLGLFIFFSLFAGKVAGMLHERIVFQVELLDDSTAIPAQLAEQLAGKPYVEPASLKFISKENAAEIMTDEGFDLSVLPENPFFNSYEFAVRKAFLDKGNTATQLDFIESDVKTIAGVRDVFFPRLPAEKVIGNVKTFTRVLLFIGLGLLLIAYILIDNALRLSLYADRMIIKTMELVGARRSFIMRPYLRRAFWQGIISAAIASVLLYITFVSFLGVESNMQGMGTQLAVLVLFMFVAGVLISIGSTWLGIRKYLAMRLDELY